MTSMMFDLLTKARDVQISLDCVGSTTIFDEWHFYPNEIKILDDKSPTLFHNTNFMMPGVECHQ